MVDVAHRAGGGVYLRWWTATLGAERYYSGLLDHGGRPTRGYAEVWSIDRTLPTRYTDALTNGPMAQEPRLGPRQVRVLR